ncbi:hypothetical protein ERO13_D13G167148v2 [Gossypium hirsutum]|uniref:Uncharacterized protein n=1 Tax=Gossypium mustelinum TaxID=34275 RepID=A0A5D2S4C9_GOSMU|nr:hypothetical protein ERO13_D13G167148v2 [Gossypium hirsutum]TYI47739.1 hypothetical protein E1A91_D13G195200v1 [Gossypium mustelinum]
MAMVMAPLSTREKFITKAAMAMVMAPLSTREKFITKAAMAMAPLRPPVTVTASSTRKGLWIRSRTRSTAREVMNMVTRAKRKRRRRRRSMKMAMKAAAAATVIRSSIIVLVFLSLMVSGAWNECEGLSKYLYHLYFYMRRK